MIRGPLAVLSLRLRGLPLMWAAAAGQALRTLDPPWAAAFLTYREGLLLVLAVWVLGIAFTVINMQAVHRPARLALGTFATGFTLNSLTSTANGGMPFSTEAARRAGLPERAIATPTAGHRPVTDQTTLTIFSDVIQVPALRAVISAGDLLMVGGITALMATLMWHGTLAKVDGASPTAGDAPDTSSSLAMPSTERR